MVIRILILIMCCRCLILTVTRLDSVELYPFKKAVEAGVGGVMIGHLHVSELDEKPASISSEVITSLLRKELHFSGLVFTDALEMKGISKNADDLCVQP